MNVDAAPLHDADEHAVAPAAPVADVALLYDLLDRLSRAETLEAIFVVAMDAVQSSMHVERTSILLFDPDGVMRFKAWRGLSARYRATVEGHTPWSAEDRDAVAFVVPDVQADASLAPYAPVFAAEGIRALGFIPLVTQGRLIGKFMVYAPSPRSFSAGELRLAQTVASQVATAVARRFAEEAHDAARRAAEEANRAKDDFLAVVSHELRTPLSAIGGWAGLLRAQGAAVDGATLAKGLEVIERNVAAQKHIIDDILDVSRITAGKLVLERRPVDVRAEVDEVLDALREGARAKGLELRASLGEEARVVAGDPARLRQIVTNLVSNAIKFTERGGRVDVAVAGRSGEVELRVSDTGAGISDELLPHVFDRFRQGDSSTTRAHGGLGLGLAIVKQLVEVHGGHVEARSDGPGHGSTFIVRLPSLVADDADDAARADDAASADDAARADGASRADGGVDADGAADLTGLVVLVVDDHADARELARAALSSLGATVVVAGSAHEALLGAEAVSPDVVVSDLGMPGTDGIALLGMLRDKGAPLAAVPAIALSAYAGARDAERARRAGFVAHVAKPARLEILAAEIAAAARLRGPSARR